MSDNISLVSNLPKFSYLKLASCKLHNFPDLRNQTRLQYLDLSNNIIEGNIPTWIWEVGNGKLSYMNLSHNRLTGHQEPCNFPNLSVLDLHSNLLVHTSVDFVLYRVLHCLGHGVRDNKSKG
ncbi:putative leucine-rich repeat domain superfamily [Helianthus debilis subsp. tardiflorus]